jgi:hypothetical protein
VTHTSHKVTDADLIKRGGEYHRVMLAGEAVIGAYDKQIPWEEWTAANWNPRKLQRRNRPPQLRLL